MAAHDHLKPVGFSHSGIFSGGAYAGMMMVFFLGFGFGSFGGAAGVVEVATDFGGQSSHVSTGGNQCCR